MKTRAFNLLISLFCASSLLVACGGKSADDLLASAKQYLEKNDKKAAVIQLKNVLQKNPDSPEARFLLGRTLLQSGDVVSSGVELRKAQGLGYPSSQVVPLLAKSLLANREYKKLTDEFGNSVIPEPQAMAELKTTVAAAYAAQGNTDQARVALRSAFESVSDYAPALVFEARLEARALKSDRALNLLEKALSENPVDAEAWHLKGELLYHAKSDHPAAMRAYRKALSINSSYFPAHVSIIDALFSQRDLTGAKVQLEEFRKVFPGQLQIVYFDAQLAYLNNDNKKAEEFIQTLLKVVSGDPKVLQLAGAIEFKNQSLLRAEDYFQKALQLAPTLSGARRMLALVYISSGQTNKALATLEPLLSRDDVDAETLSIAAQAKARAGDTKQANAYLIRAAKLTPTETKSRVALAINNFKSGNDDTILGEIETIAASDNSSYADSVLVNAYIQKKEFDKALKAVETIERKEPGKANVANLRGQIQLLRKDKSDARRSFERALAIDPVFVPAATNLALLDLADNKPDLSKKRFENVLAADPKNLQALLALAGLRARAGGSAEEVGSLLAEAVKMNPTNATPRVLLTNHYLNFKNPKRALAVAQDAIAALPQSPEILDALGRALSAAGERNQAINAFNQLIKIQPDSPQVYMQLARIYSEEKNVDQTRTSLKRALGIKPDLLIAQRALIALELSSQRPDEALAVARTVRSQRPSNDAGFLLEGAVEVSRKNFATAIDVYRAGLRQTSSTEIASQLHATLNAAGKSSEAEKFAVSWTKEHPKDSGFVWYLGGLSLAQHNYTAAEEYFRRVDQLTPDNALVLNNLAWLMAQLNKPGAVAYAQKADALLPNKPVILDTLAFALVSEKQVAKAIEVQKRALALAPDAYGMRLSLAKMYIQAGDKAAARAELDKLSKLDEKFAGQAEVIRLLATL